MCLLIINVVIYSDGGAFGQTVNHTESQEQRSCSVVLIHPIAGSCFGEIHLMEVRIAQGVGTELDCAW
jgi:hypothetical protein